MMKRHEPTEPAGLQRIAPSPHMEAFLRALEATDEAVTPLMKRGMDPRTAVILKEIEKSGALAVREEGDEIFVDVFDRKAALTVVDRLLRGIKA